jgi:hypothetical protein
VNPQEKIPGVLTPEESARNLRKLSDGINAAIRENFGPMTPEEKKHRLSVREHAAFRESLSPPPGDAIDDLLADVRRVASEKTNHPRKL